MRIFNLFKPAPNQTEITDQEKVKSLYRYWRIRTFYSMYVGYALFYFSRKTFTVIKPVLTEVMGVSNTVLGNFDSIFAITYGLSKFISGVMSDRSNPRFFMSIGLIITGLCNLCFGFTTSLLAFALFWGLNGWFQGYGWPPCAKLLTHWYSIKERGTVWSLWNTSHNLGGATIPIIVSFIGNHFNWQMSVMVPGMLCILGGFFLMNRLRDTPQSLGLPPIEKFKQEPGADKAKDLNKERLAVKEILFKYVLNNKFIWTLAIANFFIYIVRSGMDGWLVQYLARAKGYPLMSASKVLCIFEIGGFVGSLLAGWSSDFFFKAKRGPINVIYTFCITIMVILFWKTSGISIWYDGAMGFFLGFFIFGPQMLIGVTSAELSHKKAAGTATGFGGAWGYIGTAVAGTPLGWLIDHYSWGAYFQTLMISGLIALLLFIPLWGVHRKPANI